MNLSVCMVSHPRQYIIGHFERRNHVMKIIHFQSMTASIPHSRIGYANDEIQTLG